VLSTNLPPPPPPQIKEEEQFQFLFLGRTTASNKAASIIEEYVPIYKTCPVCRAEEESIEYLTFFCPHASQGELGLAVMWACSPGGII